MHNHRWSAATGWLSPMKLSALALSVAMILALIIVVPAADSAAANPLLPDDGALVGMFVNPPDGDWTKDGVKRRWNKVENAADRKLDIGHLFEPWGSSFPGWEEQWHVDNGRTPMVSWAHTYTSDIVAGKHDAHIRARADEVKKFGEPILIRWFWEMDGNNKGKYAENPETYIKAWRRIVTTFRNRGADNAQFVWCPNAWAFTKGNAAKWYPGDGYVDWLCADGYNWNPGRDGDKWRDLGEIFKSYHDWGKGRGKPMMIGETGVMERNWGEKAGWYRQALVDLKKKLPALDAIVFFDSKKVYDWRLDSTQKSFDAWIEIVNSPYLQGDGGGGGATTTKAPTTTTTTSAPTTTQPPAGEAPGAVAFRASSTTVGNAKSYTVAVPGKVRAGDALLLIVSINNNETSIATPSGWSKIDSQSAGSMKTQAMIRVARSGDAGSSVTVGLGRQQKAVITLAAYSGADPKNPLASYKVRRETDDRKRHVAPRITSADGGDTVVRYWADKTSRTDDWATPSGETKRAELIGSGSGRVTSILTDSAGNSANAVSAVAAAANSATDKATMWTFVLRPRS
jgi:hypothetical protein